MLDQQLRLITPAETREADSTDGPAAARYQLTHDYLVPSIRQWVVQRRSMTFRGRVRSTMIDRAEQWNQLPETRLLPAWWEDIGFRLFTRSKDWNEAHRRMMSRSGRRVLLLLVGAIAALMIAFFAARDVNGRFRANAVHKRLLNANTNELPAILDDAEAYRSWLLPSLEGLSGLDSATSESGHRSRRRELHRQLALLRLNERAAPALYESLLEAQPAAYATINRILPQHTRSFDADVLWACVKNTTGPSDQRRRAAAMLAKLDPSNNKWSEVAEDVAKLLAKSDPAEAGYWITELTPVRDHLAEHLKPNLGGRGLDLTTRRTTARALAGFYARDVEKLVELTVQSRSVEFAEFAPVLLDFGPGLSEALTRAESLPPGGDDVLEATARRDANIAALRLHIQSKPDFTTFEAAADPTARSYLIHHYPISGGGATPLMALLDGQQSPAVRYSVLLTLGEISRERFTTDEFEKLISTARKWFKTDPDPGVHSACGWLLRTFGEADFVQQANRELASNPVPEGQGWYVSASGLTMIQVKGPFDLRIGSSKEDLERFYNEAQLVRHCGRSFALSSTEITRRLYAEFAKENKVKMPNVRLPFESEDAAVTEVFWPRAAQFCNWLSKRDGIPEDQWCYAPNKDGKYASGVFQRENNLQLAGYRMPTHYEWEYATKAGTVTSRFYGRGTDLLKNYSWHSSNSQMIVHEPGQLKPSHWGFFDTLGNAYEWCTARASMQIELGPTHPPHPVPGNRLMRVRGGSFVEQARYHRAPRRSYFSAMTDGEQIGIRVARTIKVHDTKTPIVDRLDTRYFEDKN